MYASEPASAPNIANSSSFGRVMASLANGVGPWKKISLSEGSHFRQSKRIFVSGLSLGR